MTKPIAQDPIFRKRVFDVNIIAAYVRESVSDRLMHAEPLEIMEVRARSARWRDSNRS